LVAVGDALDEAAGLADAFGFFVALLVGLCFGVGDTVGVVDSDDGCEVAGGVVAGDEGLADGAGDEGLAVGVGSTGGVEIWKVPIAGEPCPATFTALTA
jgi:hypothetical protein